MRALLRRLGLAPYGGDELALTTLACAALAWALGAGLSEWAALAALPPWLFVVWFFRDPERHPPEPEGLWVAPADGTVKDVEEVEEPSFVGERALRIGIFLSPLDIHVNRAPCGSCRPSTRGRRSRTKRSSLDC
jgi:phosphatidylserine decarboxylase precursor-related protein